MHNESTSDTDLRLLESEQRYQAVIENASDMIQSVRPDGTFEFVNAAWRRALAYTDADLAHMTIWDIVDPAAMDHCQVEFMRAIRGEPISFIETVFVAKDGHPVPVEGSVTSRLIGEEVVATHGFFRDVTERNRARELEERAARLEQEERARYLEKMAALGKLSAGLAHELNNPAAAIQRASGGMQGIIQRRDEAMRAMLTADGGVERCEVIERLIESLPGMSDAPAPTDPLAMSEQETAIEDWLEARNIEDGWTFAPALVEAGIGESELEALAGEVSADAMPAALRWITESLALREASEIITQSSRRIADLVQAIKGYSHMDRATEHEGDLHDGIENTLVILGHRLRNVQVEREFDRGLPPIRMFGNSLNQVWTNLLDNAIDAMDGAGTIRIRTMRDGDQVTVEIEDGGTGIPPEQLSRIFEPFFTTKPQGVGTGLGLDTVWRIITEEHGGTIAAESEPGRTVFRVTLPAGGAT